MMKLNYLTRSSPLPSIISPIFSLSPKSTRPISFSPVPTRPVSPKPQTPIFLKPPVFSATVSDLKQWQHWAQTLASSVGPTFSESDNGPDSSLLLRELTWLLQDCTENIKPTFIDNNCRNGGDSVKLRVELRDLYELWRERIEERRPFQYVVGCEHWRDLVLSVEEGVLIPRPETELIVDLVGEVVDEGNVGLREGLWADLGTGSGALAIGIARVLGENGRVVGVDSSPVAVRVASYNVERYCLQDKILIKEGSWFEPLKEAEGKLDGLVSNPPYIPSGQINGLQAEVANHEPRLALDGGEDGMGDLLHLCNGAVSMLKPGGFFAFETNGEDQCKFLVDYMETKTKGVFYNVKIVSDFAGIHRFVTGFRAG